MKGVRMATGQVFKTAVRQKLKARIALAGPSGSGKTFSALAIASGLGERIACIDTEHGSASLYADRFTFDVLELEPPFSPARYVEAIRAAEAAGYDVVVIDSLSHAWFGEGGTLDIAEANKRGGNSFSGWAVATPQQNRMVDAIVRANVHIIATLRSKTEWALNEKNQPQKLGLGPVQKDGIDYEFTIAGEMDLTHRLSISKSRLSVFQGQVVTEPDSTFGKTVLAELEQGLEDPAGGDAGHVAQVSSENSVGAGADLQTTDQPTLEGAGEESGATPSSNGWTDAGAGEDTEAPSAPASPEASAAQHRAIRAAQKRMEWSDDDLHGFAQRASLTGITKEDASKLLTSMAQAEQAAKEGAPA